MYLLILIDFWKIFFKKFLYFQKKISRATESRKLETLLTSKNNIDDSTLNILNDESSSIQMCLKMSEDLAKGTLNLEEEIGSQNKILKNTSSKIDTILSKFPVIGKVLSSIKFHKYKEKIILGLVIGLILYLGLYLIFNKH